MTQSGKLSQQERDAILGALKSGKSQNATAREFGCSPATACRIAKAAGLKYDAPKNTAAGLADFNIARRIALGNRLFEHVERLSANALPANQLRELALTYAILVDKRRLEDGEVTGRVENVNADVARERVASFVDELATRRRAKEATG